MKLTFPNSTKPGQKMCEEDQHAISCKKTFNHGHSFLRIQSDLLDGKLHSLCSDNQKNFVFIQFPVSFLKLQEKCPYSVFFWTVFSAIRAEYREIRSISPYSIEMRENTDQKNSKYGYFSRSVTLPKNSHFFYYPYLLTQVNTLSTQRNILICIERNYAVYF